MAENLFIIIQARMTSTRLPGKVLLPLCGRTALEMMLDRLEQFKEKVIIATTNDGTEEPIVGLCQKNNIKYYQGDTENVLSRYFEAAQYFGAKSGDRIVRLTSDCPLIDKDVMQAVIDYFGSDDYDYVSNTVERSYPRGLDCEVFSFGALKESYENAQTMLEKEHVTTYIHTTHKERFKLGSFKDAEDNSKYRLTLDEADDYKAIKEVYKLFECQTRFSYKELIGKLKENPFIYDINKHIEQKKQ